MSNLFMSTIATQVYKICYLFPDGGGGGEKRRGKRGGRGRKECAKGEKMHKKAHFLLKMVIFAHNRVVFRLAGGGGRLATWRGGEKRVYCVYWYIKSCKRCQNRKEPPNKYKGGECKTWKIDIIKAKFA